MEEKERLIEKENKYQQALNDIINNNLSNWNFKNDSFALMQELVDEVQSLKSAQNKLAVEKLEEIKDRLESLDYKTSSKKEQNEKINYSVNALLSDLKGEEK